MVGSFPDGIKTRVMRVPTEGVVFKFGNAGRLASTFAVLLPRTQNDWLRVEVVPGHTPFLISNAALGKLRGIVDVGGKKLYFGGSEVSIPLFGVRKNLLGVKVTDLLLKTPRLHTRAQTHILHAEDNFEDQPHTSHDHGHVTTPSHAHHHEGLGGIQENLTCFPKENAVHNFSVFTNQVPFLSSVIRNIPQVESHLKVQPLQRIIMEGHATYLTRALSAPEDPSLQTQVEHHEMPKILPRPPGVATLEEWGMTVIPGGKHHGKRFSEIYLNDRQYVKQLWNRKAVSTWVRSFQLYCRHRREASVEHQEEETRRQGLQMPINPHMTPEVAELIKKGGAPWLSPRSNARAIKEKSLKDQAPVSSPTIDSKKASAEWQYVETENKMNKRGPPTTSGSSMEIQPNQDRVNQLYAQIAVLQRDLQHELNGTTTPLEDA